MKAWLIERLKALGSWWAKLSVGDKIQAAGVAVAVLSIIVTIICTAVSISHTDKTTSKASERQDDFDEFSIRENDERDIPVSATNVVGSVGTNSWAATVDFGVTNPCPKPKGPTIRLVSNVVHLSGMTVLDEYAIPRPPAVNLYIGLSPEGSVTGEVFNVHYTTKMSGLVREATRAFHCRRYTNAVEKAKAAWELHVKLMEEAKGNPMRFDDELITGLLEIIPILVEDAMARGDWDEMVVLANQYDEFCAERPTVYAEAMRDIAQLKRDGRKLIFFSASQLRQLRKKDQKWLIGYLTMLAVKGFIQPFELDAGGLSCRSFSHKRFFGLPHEIRYVKWYQYVRKDGGGRMIYSNRVSGQWAGMGKAERIDIDEAAAIELGVPKDQRMEYPIDLQVEFAEMPWGPEPTGRFTFRRIECLRPLGDYLNDLLVDEDPKNVEDGVEK